MEEFIFARVRMFRNKRDLLAFNVKTRKADGLIIAQGFCPNKTYRNFGWKFKAIYLTKKDLEGVLE